jgi:hypothetical protein
VLYLLACRFDEKRYTSAIVEPPVPKLYFAQMDALNDCLVIENLANVRRGEANWEDGGIDGYFRMDS